MAEQRFRPLSTFSGLRNVPLVATSFNSLYPSLTVKPGGLTIVVVRTHDFAFDEIEAIEAAWRFGHMVTIGAEEGMAHLQRQLLWQTGGGESARRAARLRRAAVPAGARLAFVSAPLRPERASATTLPNRRAPCSAWKYGNS